MTEGRDADPAADDAAGPGASSAPQPEQNAWGEAPPPRWGQYASPPPQQPNGPPGDQGEPSPNEQGQYGQGQQGQYGQGQQGQYGQGQQGQYGQGQYGQGQYGQAPYGQGQPGQYGQYGQHPGAPHGYPPPRTAPRPGIIPLRPLSLGELFDGAFRAIRTNPKVMFGLSAAVVTVTALIQLAITWSVFQDLEALMLTTTSDTVNDLESLNAALGDLVSQLGVTFGASTISAIVTTILSGLLIVSVSQSVLGRKADLGEVWAAAKGRILRLLALSLLVVLIVLAPMVPWAAALIATLAQEQWGLAVAVGLLGGVLVLVAGAYLVTKTVLATPALMLERSGIVAALRRGWVLTSGTFWRVFGIYVLTSLLVGAVAGSISFSTSLILQFAGPDPTTAVFSPLYLIGTTIAQIVAAALTTPFHGGRDRAALHRRPHAQGRARPRARARRGGVALTAPATAVLGLASLGGVPVGPADVPLTPDAAEARRWATDELARGIYTQRTGLVQQLIDWLIERIDELSRLGSGGAGWLLPSAAVLLTAVAVAVAIVVGPPGRRRRERGQAAPLLDGDARSAEQLRAAANSAAARGDLVAAILDRFRALVRGLGERAILEDRPGLTAHEAVVEAGRRLPGLAADLLVASELFDRVAYGHTAVEATDDGWLRALDARVSSTRPTSAAGEAADADAAVVNGAPR